MMDPQVRRVAKTICAHEADGFCQTRGGKGDLDCPVGRGSAPHWSKCKASDDQLAMCGLAKTARAVIHECGKV